MVGPTLEVPADVSELEPRVLPNLRLGEEFVVVGKRVSAAPFEVTLRGRLNGWAYALPRPVSVDAAPASLPFASRLWAQARIGELEAAGDASALKEVVELSTRFRVMSRQTSWLVLESEQMFADFGIPRSAREPSPELLSERAAISGELDQVDLGGLGSLGSPSADRAKGVFSFWDVTDPDKGTMGVALLIDPRQIVDVIETDSDWLVLVKVNPGKPFVYYMGAAWDKGLDFHTRADWETYVFAQKPDFNPAR